MGFISLFANGTLSPLITRWLLDAQRADTFSARRDLATLHLAELMGRVWWLGLKDTPPERTAAFSAARARQEEAVRARPDDGPSICALSLIDAALGRKEEALREGRRALELTPIARDSINGIDLLYYYAVTCAEIDERDLAIEQLETLAKIPAGRALSTEISSLNPNWDRLRGDPQFEKIVASLAPR